MKSILATVTTVVFLFMVVATPYAEAMSFATLSVGVRCQLADQLKAPALGTRQGGLLVDRDDTNGRLATKSETREWTSVGGGGIPGLDGGWQGKLGAPATALVSYAFVYDGSTDRLSGQVVTADGRGENANGLRTFQHRYVEDGIKYDNQFRQSGSTTLTIQPKLEYTYYHWTRNTLGKVNDHWSPDTPVRAPGVVSVSRNRTTEFDEFGRPFAMTSDFVRDDRNWNNGHSAEALIYYSANTGEKVGSQQLASYNDLRGISEGGDGATRSRPGPIAETVLSEWNKKGTSYALGLMGTLWGSFRNQFDPGNYDHPNGDGDYVGQRTSYSGKNAYIYDLFGNLNEKATRAASEIDSKTEQSGGVETNATTEIVTTVLQAVSIALMFIPGTQLLALALKALAVAVVSALQAGLQGASIGKALKIGAIQGAAAFAGSSIAKTGFAKGLEGFSKVTFNAAVSVSLAVAVAYGTGMHDNHELWRTAASAAVSSIAGGFENSNLLLKAVVVGVLNAAAAYAGGVKDWRKLLTIAAISAALTYSQGPEDKTKGDTKPEKKDDQLGFKDYAGAFLEAFTGALLGEVVARVVANNVGDTTTASIVASVVEFTVNMTAKNSEPKPVEERRISGSTQKSPNLSGGFTSGIARTLRRLDSERRAIELRTYVYGSGTKDVQHRLDKANRESKEGNAYVGALAELGSGGFFVLVNKIGTELRYVAARLAIQSTRLSGKSVSADGGTQAERRETVDNIGDLMASGAKTSVGDQIKVKEDRTILGRLVEALEKKLFSAIGIEENKTSKIYAVLESKKDLLKQQKLITEDAVIRGFFFKDLNLNVAVAVGKDGKIQLMGFEQSNGQQTLYKFDSIKQDLAGNVLLAKGRVFRLVGDQLIDTKVKFQYAAQGTREFDTALMNAKSMVTNEAALAKLDQANRVYTETDEQGNLLRQVFMKVDDQGNAQILATFHADQTMLTYDYNESGELVGGLVFEKDETGKFGKEAVAAFKVQQLDATKVAQGAAGTLAQQLAAVLSQGQQLAGNLLIYVETGLKDQAERKVVLMDETTGQLQGIVEVGKDGKQTVTVFNGKNVAAAGSTFPDATVQNFGDLDQTGQNQVMANLPAMDKRDTAAVMAKTMALQKMMTQARLMALAEAGSLPANLLVDGDALRFTAKDLGLDDRYQGFRVTGLDETTGLMRGQFLVDDGKGGLTARENGVMALGGSPVANALAGSVTPKGSLVYGIKTAVGYAVRVRGLNGKSTAVPAMVQESALKDLKGQAVPTKGGRRAPGMGESAPKPLREKAADAVEEGIKNLPVPLKEELRDLLKQIAPYLPAGFKPGVLLKSDAKGRDEILSAAFRKAEESRDTLSMSAVSVLGWALSLVPGGESEALLAATIGIDFNGVGDDAGHPLIGPKDETKGDRVLEVRLADAFEGIQSADGKPIPVLYETDETGASVAVGIDLNQLAPEARLVVKNRTSLGGRTYHSGSMVVKVENGRNVLAPEPGTLYTKGSQTFAVASSEVGETLILKVSNFDEGAGTFTASVTGLKIMDAGKAKDLAVGAGAVLAGRIADGKMTLTGAEDGVTLTLGSLVGTGKVFVDAKGQVSVGGVLRGKRVITREVQMLNTVLADAPVPGSETLVSPLNNKITITEEKGELVADGTHIVKGGQLASVGEGTQFVLKGGVKLPIGGVVYSQGMAGENAAFQMKGGRALVPDGGLTWEKPTWGGVAVTLWGYTKSERKELAKSGHPVTAWDQPTKVLSVTVLDAKKNVVKAWGYDRKFTAATEREGTNLHVMTTDGQHVRIDLANGGAELMNPAGQSEGGLGALTFMAHAARFMTGTENPRAFSGRVKEAVNSLTRTVDSAVTNFQTRVGDGSWKSELTKTVHLGWFQTKAVSLNSLQVGKQMGAHTGFGLTKTTLKVTESTAKAEGSFLFGGPLVKQVAKVLGIEADVPGLSRVSGYEGLKASLSRLGITVPTVPTLRGEVLKVLSNVNYQRMVDTVDQSLYRAEVKLAMLQTFSLDQGWGTTGTTKLANLAMSILLETPHLLVGLSSESAIQANGGFLKAKGAEWLNGAFNAMIFVPALGSMAGGSAKAFVLYLNTGWRGAVMGGAFAGLGAYNMGEVLKNDDSPKGKTVDLLLLSLPIGYHYGKSLHANMLIREAMSKGKLSALATNPSVDAFVRASAAEEVVRGTGMRSFEVDGLRHGAGKSPGQMEKFFERLRKGDPAAQAELVRLREEKIGPFLERKMEVKATLRALKESLPDSTVDALSRKLVHTNTIGARLKGLMEALTPGSTKTFLESALKMLNENKGRVTGKLLSAWESLARKQGLSVGQASMALFGEKGMFKALRTAVGKALANATATAKVMPNGVVELTFKFQNLNGTVTAKISVTREGLKGVLVNQLEALKTKPLELKAMETFVNDLLGSVTEYKTQFNEMRRTDVQNSGRGQNQPTEVQGTGDSATGTNPSAIPPKGQPPTSPAGRVAESKQRILNQFDDNSRTIGSIGELHQSSGRDVQSLRKNRTQGAESPLEGNNKGLRDAYGDLRKNLEKALDNPTKKNIQDFAKSLDKLKSEFNAAYNARLDTAAETFAGYGHRESQIRDIKTRYEGISKTQGGSLTAEQIKAKHKEYAVELNHVVEGVETLLAKNGQTVQSIYETSRTKTQARAMIRETYNRRNVLTQNAEARNELKLLFKDATDGTADLTLRALTAEAAEKVDWFQEILDNTDNIPYDLPKPNQPQNRQSGGQDKKDSAGNQTSLGPPPAILQDAQDTVFKAWERNAARLNAPSANDRGEVKSPAPAVREPAPGEKPRAQTPAGVNAGTVLLVGAAAVAAAGPANATPTAAPMAAPTTERTVAPTQSEPSNAPALPVDTAIEDGLSGAIDPSAPNASVKKTEPVPNKWLWAEPKVNWGDRFAELKTDAAAMTLADTDLASLKALETQVETELSLAKETTPLKARIAVELYGLEVRRLKGETGENLKAAEQQLQSALTKEGEEAEIQFAQAALLLGGMGGAGREMTLRVTPELSAVTGMDVGQEVTLKMRAIMGEAVWAAKGGAQIIISDGAGPLAGSYGVQQTDSSVVMFVKKKSGLYEAYRLQETAEGVEVRREKGTPIHGLDKKLDWNLDAFFAKGGTAETLAEKTTKFLWHLLPGWKDVVTVIVRVFARESEADFSERKKEVSAKVEKLAQAVEVLKAQEAELVNLQTKGQERWGATQEHLMTLGVSTKETDRLVGAKREPGNVAFVSRHRIALEQVLGSAQSGINAGRLSESGELAKEGLGSAEELSTTIQKAKKELVTWTQAATKIETRLRVRVEVSEKDPTRKPAIRDQAVKIVNEATNPAPAKPRTLMETGREWLAKLFGKGEKAVVGLSERVKSEQVVDAVRQQVVVEKYGQRADKGASKEIKEWIDDLRTMTFDKDYHNTRIKEQKAVVEGFKDEINQLESRQAAIAKELKSIPGLLAKGRAEEKTRLQARQIVLGKEQANLAISLTRNRAGLRAANVELQRRQMLLKSGEIYFKQTQQWITAKGSKRTNESLSNEITSQLCAVISYYLYARTTGQETRSLGEFYYQETRRGLIGSEMSKESSAPFYVWGSGEWDNRYHLKTIWDTDKTPFEGDKNNYNVAASLGEMESSGTRIAIAHVNNNNDPKADHFMLIYKDNEGKWINWDHTRTDNQWHGKNTDWGLVHRLIFVGEGK